MDVTSAVEVGKPGAVALAGKGSAQTRTPRNARFLMRANHFPLQNSEIRLPRALLGLPRAEGDPRRILTELTGAFGAFQARHRAEMDGVQAAVDDVNTRLAAVGAGGHAIGGGAPADPSYSGVFASWFRNGNGEADLRNANGTGDRARLQAAMSSSSNSDGGFLAPVEWDRRVVQALRTVSPMRQIASVQITSVGGYSTIWSDSAWGSGWVGETAARPNTSTPQLSQIVFKAGEIFANPAVTQILLDDAGFNVEQWLADEVAAVFALQEGVAFINGDGVNKPAGLLGYAPGGSLTHPGGSIPVVNSGAAAGLTTDGLVELVYKLPAQYRANASWLMNSTTLAKIRKFKDTGGQYLWQPSFDQGQPQTILGYPVFCDENMPDIAADALPVAFGDFKRGYVINDRTGVRVLRDPYTSKPFVSFYTTKRVGGGVLDPRALRFQRVAA